MADAGVVPLPDGFVVDDSGAPDAAVVVLVHGGMDRATSFFKVVRRLDGDLRVLRYDRRGYARNLHAPGPFTIAQHAADVVAVLQAVPPGPPAVLVGHSLGGVIALAAACRAPQLVGAVGAFEAPMSWMPWHRSTYATDSVGRPGGGEEPSPEDAAERFMRRAIGDALWERLPERTRADRRAEGRCLVAELHDVRRGPPYDLAVLHRAGIPVLAAFGSASSPHLQRAARELAEAAGTEATELPGARHGAHTSHPDEFARFVRAVVAAP